MTRKLFKFRNGRVVEVTQPRRQAGGGGAPAFFRDEILDGIESPLTGEKFYSREKYLEHIHKNGYRVTGGDHLTGNKHLMNPPKADGARIRDQTQEVWHKIRNDEVPILDKGDPIPENNLYMTRQEVEQWREEERKLESRRYRR